MYVWEYSERANSQAGAFENCWWALYVTILYVPCIIWPGLRPPPSPRLVGRTAPGAAIRQDTAGFHLSCIIIWRKMELKTLFKKLPEIISSIEPLGSWKKPAFQRQSCLYKFGPNPNPNPIHIVGFAKMGNPPPDLTRSNRCRSENNLLPSLPPPAESGRRTMQPKNQAILVKQPFVMKHAFPPLDHLSTQTRGSAKNVSTATTMCKKQRLICFVSSPRRTSMDFDI